MLICIAGYRDMDVSENRGTPKSSILIYFNRVFHYKPSILGVPLFLETPICFFEPYVGIRGNFEHHPALRTSLVFREPSVRGFCVCFT